MTMCQLSGTRPLRFSSPPERLTDTTNYLMDENKCHRILIVGPSWVGDMVMAQTLFELLMQQDSNRELSVLAPPWSRALLDRMVQVRKSLELPFRHGELKLLERRNYGRQLSGQFDTAIVMPNSFKSALIPFFAGIRQRIGWRGEYRDILLTDSRRLDEKKYPLMTQRFAALGFAKGIEINQALPRPSLTVSPENASRTLLKLALNAEPGALAICPGAEFGNAKQWPALNYARLCEMVINAGWQVWIIGSGNDRTVARQIMNALNPALSGACHDITGQTSLDQAIDVLAAARAVVSNDSGLMHIGCAVNRPVVAIYGSTSPDFTPPLGERVKSIATDISCRPCFERECPLGHLRCLTEISAEQVFGELQVLTATQKTSE